MTQLVEWLSTCDADSAGANPVALTNFDGSRRNFCLQLHRIAHFFRYACLRRLMSIFCIFIIACMTFFALVGFLS